MEASPNATELREASQCLSSRCLSLSAKWILELLVGLVSDRQVAQQQQVALSRSEYETPACEDAGDVVQFAKACFESREFARCAQLLETGHSSRGRADAGTDAWASLPPYPRFLRWYALYMDGERRKEAERQEGADSLGRTRAPLNPHLPLLQQELEAAEATSAANDSRQDQHGSEGLDAFGLYLLGVVYKATGRTDEARQCLVSAVGLYPPLWSAWLDLAATCPTRASLEELFPSLPAHWMADMFKAHAYNELHVSVAALQVLAPLSAAFPNASGVKAMVAKALYDLQRPEKALQLFESIRQSDPHRLDDMDTYSHLLFVQNDRPRLAALAQSVHGVDRFRPSSCVVLANYFSMRREHDKAVTYFRRALRLDPSYSAAWTLMGHEYMELRNYAAAIECYRRGTSASETDYRAWYGLGQAYELLQMHLYASYYYKKAAALQPYDARMWIAIGACSEKLERKADAVAAYERAVSLGGGDGAATLALARVYLSDGNKIMASKYYSLFVQDKESSNGSGGPNPRVSQELAEPLLFLARQAQEEGRKDAAEAYAMRILAMPAASEAREARAILDAIRKDKAAAEAMAKSAATVTRPGLATPARPGLLFGLATSGVSASGIGASMSFASPDPTAAFGADGSRIFGDLTPMAPPTARPAAVTAARLGGAARVPVTPGRGAAVPMASPEPSGNDMAVDFSDG